MASRLVCFLLVITASLVSKSHQQSESEKNDIRLPKFLSPVHYLVRLQPFLSGNFTFNGYVEITFEVKEKTNRIVLHIADILTKNETTKVYAMESTNQSLGIRSQEYDPEREFYIATLNEDLEEGKAYIISMKFQGFLNEQMKGFYRSSYRDDNGTTIYLASTQFEPTDARRAFPCFDEPAFKAKFSIEMIREDGVQTISNMPLIDSTPSDNLRGWSVDRFNTSFPMSTYLVAFIVSDFGYLEGVGDQKYKFRVYARKNALSRAKYAVELGPKVSRFYEKYFNVSFPLPKQDMAAVPDFSAGAMENWGLITYRESSFLYDPEIAKAKDKMHVANIIAHELAHQWFGDLVTPSWWTDLWLNEGFASYMEYLGLRETEPSLKPLDQLVVDEIHSAFALDCLETSHPISIPVGNPDEINSIFDSISYSKGAAVIRMMSSFLTETTFTHGLTNYLTELSYQNAKQDDLWRYLTDVGHSEGTLDSNITVKEVMDTWTLQMGYPVVNVQRNDDGTATFSQQRFLLVKGSNSTPSEHEYKWWIPLTFTIQSEKKFNDTRPKEWMSPSETTKVIQGALNRNEWIIVNIDQVGFYRVNYDAENWEAISSQLSSDPTVIPDANRAQIIDDSFNLARAGQLSYPVALNLMKYLKTEKEFAPLVAASDNLYFIENMFVRTGGYGFLKNYLLSLIIPLYDEVKFVDSLSDPLLEQRKRALVLSWACTLDHTPCVDESVKLYKEWMADPENTKIISPNLKSTVYCTAIRQGGAKEWKFAWDRYMKTNIGTEQKELLQALGCSEDVWILGEYLNRSVTPNQGIKSQNVRYIFPAVAKSPVGKYVSWQFLRNNWDRILKLFGSVSFVLDDIISAVTQSLNTEVQLAEMMSFKREYEGRFSSAARTVEQSVENLKNNVHWMNLHYNTIVDWLKSSGYQNDI